jgi:hypothetical protein
MNEPESLDEQALMEEWHDRCPRCPNCQSHRHAGDCDPPEYQHPESDSHIFDVFEGYEQITDQRLNEDQ